MKEYIDCLKYVLENGEDVNDRTGVGTKSVFGYQMRFDLSKGFPAVTTKKLAWKSVVGELLWFLEGSTDERRLAELTYGKDRTELTDKSTIWTANADHQGKSLGYVNTDMTKQLGPVYGYVWSRTENTSYDLEVYQKRSVDPVYNIIDQIIHEDVVKCDDDFVGQILQSNNGRNFRVLEKVVQSPNSIYRVQFFDNGDCLWVSRPNLKLGQVGKKLLFGVGITDITADTPILKKLYTLWYNMIRRCYDDTVPYYDYYGGRGVYVCVRWHRFKNFVADIERLPNYYSWFNNPDQYDLDNDFYCGDGYAPNTCVFIKSSDNKAYSNDSIDYSYKKVCTFEDGSSFEFIHNKSIREMYPDKNFTDDGITNAIIKKGKHRGCHFAKVYSGEGMVFRKKLVHNQLGWLLNEIRTNPDSRRLILSAWNPQLLDQQALPPCHTLFQFRVYNNKLSCQLYQRSADIGLGVPFNIASYALLTHIIARECGLEVGDFVHTIGDAHIYADHIEPIKEMLLRTPYDLPTLEIDKSFSLKDGLDFEFDINSVDMFTLKNYQSHATIKMNMAV